MRKVLLPLVAVAAILTGGCQALLTPSLCTQNVTIIDTMTVNGHQTVDTLGKFKVCAQ
jgi:hypothetical protein